MKEEKEMKEEKQMKEENKMKKEKQMQENLAVEEALIAFKSDANKAKCLGFEPAMRLRKCNAYVSRIGKWLVLTSYSTNVAVIDIQTGVLYDFLRLVYGYTATSASHISKFAHDYSVLERYTWREL